MLAFAAAARAEVLAPQLSFDERIRTHVAFEVEERGWVADRTRERIFVADDDPH
jgi:hypothetical protein